MQDIVRRTAAINQIRANSSGVPWIVVTEVVYLQLRHTLELPATALVNRHAVAQLREPGKRSWHALDILRAIEEVNDDFYPVPTNDGPRDEHGAIEIVGKTGDFLTREKSSSRSTTHAGRSCTHATRSHGNRPFVWKRRRTANDCRGRLIVGAIGSSDC